MVYPTRRKKKSTKIFLTNPNCGTIIDIRYIVMKKYEVTLFIMGLPYSEHNTRVVEVEANSQDEAEQKAHDWYIADGWGVYSSKEIV